MATRAHSSHEWMEEGSGVKRRMDHESERHLAQVWRGFILLRCEMMKPAQPHRVNAHTSSFGRVPFSFIHKSTFFSDA